VLLFFLELKAFGLVGMGGIRVVFVARLGDAADDEFAA
jgi:hypothetical protein